VPRLYDHATCPSACASDCYFGVISGYSRLVVPVFIAYFSICSLAHMNKIPTSFFFDLV